MSKELVSFAREGRRLDIPVFDVHIHIGQWAMCGAYDTNDQLAEMDRLGVKQSVVSSAAAIDGDVRRGNDEVAALVAKHPARFLGYVHVNTNYTEDVLPELHRCFALPGFAGIKVYQQDMPYDDARFEPVWEFARERGVPVLAHTWAGALTGLDKVAKRFPTVPFMAAHVTSDLRCQNYINAAKEARNFHLDLTCSRDYACMVEHFVKTVGADQIVWGSDQPLFSMAQQLGKVLFARISDEDKRKILYGNAARCFGLKG